MELLERIKSIEEKLISILDYAHSVNMAYAGGILYVEVLAVSEPENIDIHSISKPQLYKHYGERFKHYEFDLLRLISKENYYYNIACDNFKKFTYTANVANKTDRIFNNIISREDI